MLHLTEGNERIPKVDYKGYHMNIRLFSELAMSDGWLDSTMQAINDRIKAHYGDISFLHGYGSTGLT